MQNFISDPLAQDEILAWLVANAQEPGDVTEEARRIEAARQIKGEVEAAEAKLRRLKGKRSRLADLYSDGDIDRNEYRAKRAEVDVSMVEAQAELEDSRERQELNGPDQVRQFDVLAAEWPRLDNGTKRDALLAVVHYFVVVPKDPKGPRSQRGRLVPIERWRRIRSDGYATDSEHVSR